MRSNTRLWIFCLLSIGLASCSSETKKLPDANGNESKRQAAVTPAEDSVEIELAKLSDADRALAREQEWCVISTEERLGLMGSPQKLVIEGQTVFVCCSGCKRKAESDPSKTLAILKELKEKHKQKAEAKQN